ncbi:GtrA family protein [Flavobacteriales bacterium]|jgi:putative flippase GtrA|nr:GtrA family protein [Flavobacteriales bacterium]|tara:strand:- start:322 stop:696 length:375 start_codon:yes stop_codon:yes gene_type:complete
MLIKFIKFLIVGVSGLIIDFGLTYLCKEKIKLNKYLSNSIGFLAAGINNFILNREWTYNGSSGDIMIQFPVFISIVLVSLLILNATVWLGINKLKLNFYLSKMIGIVIITFLNFYAHLFITFNI